MENHLFAVPLLHSAAVTSASRGVPWQRPPPPMMRLTTAGTTHAAVLDHGKTCFVDTSSSVSQKPALKLLGLAPLAARLAATGWQGDADGGGVEGCGACGAVEPEVRLKHDLYQHCL